MASVTLSPRFNAPRSRPALIARWYCNGLTPISRLKSLCTVKGLSPATRPNSLSRTARSRFFSRYARTTSKGLRDSAPAWAATKTRVKAGGLRLHYRSKKAHVLAQGPATGATGTAKYSRRRHAVNETRLPVARDELLPGYVGIEGRNLHHSRDRLCGDGRGFDSRGTDSCELCGCSR